MQSSEKYWNISEETGKLLAFLIEITKKESVLEIGTSNGYSATWLSKNAKKVITIEQRDDWYQEAVKNLKDYKNVKVLHGNALEIIPTLKEKFDFVFIDAKKNEYLKYFNAVKPLLKDKALIVADNTISHKDKMKDFLEEIKKYQTIELEIGKGLTITII